MEFCESKSFYLREFGSCWVESAVADSFSSGFYKFGFFKDAEVVGEGTVFYADFSSYLVIVDAGVGFDKSIDLSSYELVEDVFFLDSGVEGDD